MEKLHIKKDDTVVVLSGESKGTRGKVIATSPEEGKVIVAGANMVKKHVRPRRQGEQGGIIDVEGAMYADKVALYCEACGKGVRSKTVVAEDGSKTRVCAKCGATL